MLAKDKRQRVEQNKANDASSSYVRPIVLAMKNCIFQVQQVHFCSWSSADATIFLDARTKNGLLTSPGLP